MHLKKIELDNNWWISGPEQHYFSAKFQNFKYLYSFNRSLDIFYSKHKRSGLKYLSILNRRESKYTYRYQQRKYSNYNPTEYLEKTPEDIMYPHVAYINANDMIKYGTKIFVLFRDPSKRFISGYFQLKNGDYTARYYKSIVNISDYLSFIVYNKTEFINFNNNITNLYEIHIKNNNIKPYFSARFQEFEYLYSFNRSLNLFYNKHKKSGLKYISVLNSKKYSNYHPTEYVERTPSDILYPHVAYINANDMIKYGTKIFVLFRDPSKRFISSYFHLKNGDSTAKYYRSKPIVNISDYLSFIVYNKTEFINFNNNINNLYEIYIKNNKQNKDQIFNRLINVQFLYIIIINQI